MIGRDCQLVILSHIGRIDLTRVMNFSAAQRMQHVQMDSIDIAPIHATLPKQWQGSFEVPRGNSVEDAFIQSCQGDGNRSAGTMYQYIAEVDGSTSTFQYGGVLFDAPDNGVRPQQRIEFSAERRRRI